MNRPGVLLVAACAGILVLAALLLNKGIERPEVDSSQARQQGLHASDSRQVPILEQPVPQPPQGVGGDGLPKGNEIADDREIMPRSDSEEDWKRIYRNASLQDLEKEKKQLLDQFLALTRPAFSKRIAAGEFEVVSNDATLPLEDPNSEEVSLVEMLSRARGGGVRKTVLPKAEYPEIYHLKSKIKWVEGRIAEQENK